MAQNLIIGLAWLSIAVLAGALGVLIAGWNRVLGRDARRLLTGLLVISILHGISNWGEWHGIPSPTDPLEDYFLLLLPALWGSFLYVFLREHSRAELHRSEERYRSLTDDVLETTAAGICILDSLGHVVWVNQAVEEHSGLKRHEIVGGHYVGLIEERLKPLVDDPSGWAAEMLAIFEHEGEIGVECHVLPGADRQERWLECRGQPIHSGLYAGGRILHFYDITERKRAAEHRERLLKVLETQKAELERFVYTVSHDLKAPLITIQGFAGILQENLARGELGEAQTDLERIERAANRMEKLLEELLDLARIGRENIAEAPVDLAGVIAEALEGLRSEIDRRGAAVTVHATAPAVWGCRTRLVEVFQNLIDNSLKYLGNQLDPAIEIGAEPGENEVVCFVRDNGIGIDSKYVNKIFELFEQLDPHCAGTGIGLTIVKRIVETHGGRIWVESEGAGHGTTFWFTLGNRRPPEETEVQDAQASPSPGAELAD
ncbi:MAG: PAS domain S-box protein [Planctomycetaceae bacterium]|nr:PAS domain S-box protein [Planctomycetaceae bacterium]